MAESGGLCLFCKRSASEERAKVGHTLRKEGLTVHQYCLYFAAGLHQCGEEREGIQGFLLADIRKEASRAAKLTCKFCHLKGAATGCAVRSCRQTCHAPCGLENEFLFRHQDRFEAFCSAHRIIQKPLLVEAALLRRKNCCVCLLGLRRSQQNQFWILVCPVCETGFHRSCLQQQAWMAGLSLFQCLVCSDRHQFLEEMLTMGLEIPEYDSGRGKEERCMAETCLCPDGRTFYTRFSKYRMKTCQSCEKALGHMVCVKGLLCPSCKSKTSTEVAPDSSLSPSDAPPTGSHAHREGVAKLETSPPPVECDCPICEAKAEIPPSSAVHDQSSSPHSLPTTSSPPSPPSVSTPTYTTPSASPSLSTSQAPVSNPQPLSSISSLPSISNPPTLPLVSSTIVSSSLSPFPPQRRSFTPADLLKIAKTLPVISQPSTPLMIAEPPSLLSHFLSSPPIMQTSSYWAPGSVGGVVTPPPSFLFPHLLHRHIHAVAPATGRPPLQHLPQTSSWFPSLSPTPRPFSHLSLTPRNHHPFPSQPQRHFNPSLTGPASSSPTNRNSSLPSPSQKPRPTPPPAAPVEWEKRRVSSSADVSICSYFNYVDEPILDFLPRSRPACQSKGTSMSEPSLNGTSEVGTSISRMVQTQKTSVNGTQREESNRTKSKSEAQVGDGSISMLNQKVRPQRLKRRVSPSNCAGSQNSKRPRVTRELKRSPPPVAEKEAAVDGESSEFLTHFPLSSLPNCCRERLERERRERNDRLTTKFLQKRGMKAKMPQLILNHVKN